MTLTLQDKVTAFKQKAVKSHLLMVAVEALEEIAQSDGDPCTMGSAEYRAHERLSGIAAEALERIV